MANNYFKFKQFTVYHDKSAMKVTTDGCLLGASTFHPSPQNVLDIGSGTGLLSLMIAQRYSESLIDAVEIEESAFHQAKNNIDTCPWRNRINVIHNSIQNFSHSSENKYDLIICNPPFYSNQLKSKDPRQNIAWHSTDLSKEDLARISAKHLRNHGSAFFIYPAEESAEFQRLVHDHGLFPFYNLNIKNRPNEPVFRIISGYTKKQIPLSVEQLIIRNNDDSYTLEFKRLLKDFYLAF